MKPGILHGYTDSFLVRAAARKTEELFDGNMAYLGITVKMCLHDVIMQALRNADLLSGVVFHGGTCIQRMYNGTRLSEDLDFANIEELSGNRFFEFGEKFESAIRADLKRLGFSDDQITVTKPKNLEWPGDIEPMVRRWSMRVNVGPRGMKQMVNIELADMPSYEYSQQVFEPISGAVVTGPVLVNVEPLNAIFNDKVMAVIQRKYLKDRDIYDVGLLSSRQSFDRALFLAKMDDRGFSPDYVRERIAIVREALASPEFPESFTSEMSRFVLPGRTLDVQDPAIRKFLISNVSEILSAVEHALDEAPGPR